MKQTQKQNVQVVNRTPFSTPQLWWNWTNQPRLNLSFRFQVTYPLDLEVCRQAWQHLFDTQPMLRTIFEDRDKSVEMTQIIPDTEFSIHYEDLSDLPVIEFESRVKQIEMDLNASVDLKHWPLLKVAILKRTEEEYCFLCVYPTLIGDLLTGKILLKEFIATYEALLAGVPVPTLPEDCYADYQHFMNSIDTTAKDQYRMYWQSQLPQSGFQVPIDFVNGPNNFDSERMYCLYWDLPIEKLKGSKGSRKIASIYQYMLLGIYRAFSAWSDQKRIAITERSTGREIPIHKNMFKSIGFYVIDHPIPLEVDESLTIEEQLNYVAGQLDDSSFKGALYNSLNYELGEMFPSFKSSDVRIDYVGRMDNRAIMKGINLVSARARFCMEPTQMDMNYGFMTLGQTIREGVGDRDRMYLLDFNPMIQNDTLYFSIYYSINYHNGRTIQWFAEEFLKHLKDIIDEASVAGYRCRF